MERTLESRWGQETEVEGRQTQGGGGDKEWIAEELISNGSSAQSLVSACEIVGISLVPINLASIIKSSVIWVREERFLQNMEGL